MKMIKQEFKNLLKNKILLISVIAIIFIPILYSSIFDKSVWDPYGRSKDLPVAVVNEDKATELMGQKLDVGHQVVENLKKNKQLDWHFVSKEEAEKGMKDLKYYMVVTITEDFSKNAASVINKQPKKMELIYTTNDSLNYIANEMSTVGATSLEAQIREQVVAAYATAIVDVGEKLVVALGQAADGAGKLSTGSGQLETGLTQYTNGVGQADSGSNQLAQGTGKLASSIGPLASGVNQLDTGAQQLDTAIGRVNKALAPVQGNVGAIDASLLELSTGAQGIADALTTFENNLDPGTKQLLDHELQTIRKEIDSLVLNQQQLVGLANEATKVSQQAKVASSNLDKVGTDMTKIQTDIDTYVAGLVAETELSQDQQAGLVKEITGKMDELLDEQLASANKEINAGVTTVSKDLEVLGKQADDLSASAVVVSDVATAMSTSAQQMSRSVASIQEGANGLAAVLNQVPHSSHAATLSANLQNLSGELRLAAQDLPKALSGVGQLANGSNQLATGLNQLQGQIPTLASGVNQLNTGADQLDAGLNELAKNSPSLMSGISDLEAGAKELSTALNKGEDEGKDLKITKKNIDHFAAPTKLKNNEYSKVANYGVALAPYIMSLALFVGSMLFNFIYPIRKVSMIGQSSRDWWLSKATLGFVVASIMAIVQATIMLLIGLHVDSIASFYITAFLTAWSYMAIIMFLAMSFDNPGRFVAMILLVLQLGGAGGTFPVQLQSNFFKAIHPYLPMSYSVYAFRQAISGGIGRPLFFKSLFILSLLFLIFVGLLRYAMHILQKKNLENVSALNDNQKLQALEETK